MTLPVVLDVDTGVDDACAILLAALHPALDLRAVTCVGGNADVDAVVANTLTVLDAAGRSDVVVARGAERPLLEEAVDARHVHGMDGMGDLDWPKSTRQAVDAHAVEVLRDVLLQAAAYDDEEHRVTLVPLAPLTNIALLLRTYPQVAPRGSARSSSWVAPRRRATPPRQRSSTCSTTPRPRRSCSMPAPTSTSP